MPRGRVHEHGTRLRQPAVDDVECLARRERIGEHRGFGRQPQHREEDDPGERDLLASGQGIV
jgi:hypothetical protein